jgi:hypothetical protein
VADDEELDWGLSVDADVSGSNRFAESLGRIESQLEQSNRQLLRMELGSRRAGQGHQEHEKHVKGLMGSMERLIHQGLEPFLHKAKEIAEFEFIREGTEKLLELPEKLIDEVKDLGEEMIMAAAKAERFDMAFGNALGKKEGGEVLEYIEKIGKHTEFTQQQLKGMNLELAKSGYSGGGLAKATEAMIDLASMSANPQEGASRAMSALERLKTTGKLESRALVPFGISEQSLMDEMGKEAGMSSKTGTSSTGAKVASQVQKAMEAGRIPIETELNSLYTLITKKTGKALGGAGADMETLLATKITHLQELPELYFEKIKGTTGYEHLSEQVGKLLDGLDPESPRGKRIFAGLETAFDHIADIMSTFDLAGVIEEGIDALDLFAQSFVGMIALLPGETGRKAAMLEAEMGVRRLAKARHDAQAQADDEADASSKAALEKANADSYRNAPASERADAMRKGLYDAADDETPWLVKGIDKANGDFEEAGQRAGKALEKGTRDATKTHSPSEVFAEVGRDLAAGVAVGVDDGSDQVQAAINRMATIPTPSGGGALGGGGGATIGQLTIAPVFHIDGAGASAEEIAQMAVDKLNDQTPGVLQSALEQIAMSGGPIS